MFDWLDDMLPNESPDVKHNSNNLKRITDIERVTDQVRKAVRTGNLSEKFPVEENQKARKRRPKYLARAIKKSLQQIREYEEICRGLAEPSVTGRRKAKGKEEQSDRKEVPLDQIRYDSPDYY